MSISRMIVRASRRKGPGSVRSGMADEGGLDSPDSMFNQVASYYDELVERHGDSARSCDYGDPRSQIAKFEVLASVAPLEGRRVLDVGCGLGHFADFLKARYSELTYVGVDLSPRMIELGRELHPGLDLRVANILTEDPGEFDVVAASGIFYLLGEQAADLMRQIVSRMYSHAGVAIAWNSLSAWAPDQQEGEFYADPLEAVRFTRSLTPWVTMRHDYHPRDFTIYAYRESRRS
jgi:SAM-dependent methyltransferase